MEPAKGPIDKIPKRREEFGKRITSKSSESSQPGTRPKGTPEEKDGTHHRYTNDDNPFLDITCPSCGKALVQRPYSKLVAYNFPKAQ